MYILFLRESLAEHQIPIQVPSEQQVEFIEAALKQKAKKFQGASINYPDLDDAVMLGRAWGMDKSNILTEFILIMYELGKDEIIQHLVSSTRLIEIERFQNGGMPIACVRLDAALTMLKKSKRCRGTLAMLDADTCEWVKEQAEICKVERPDRVIHTHTNDGTLILLFYTRELILRIKRMSSANRIDATALGIMCETLMKAAEVFE